MIRSVFKIMGRGYNNGTFLEYWDEDIKMASL